ncbi:MAG: hypothetical protein ABI741_07325 [Ferruginibacter sp.]
MELEDLKNTWGDVTNQVKNQQKLNPEMIEQMTRAKYHSRLKKIACPEIIGVIICMIGAGYIVLNFSKLAGIFLQAAGIISILLLLLMSAISLLSLPRFHMSRDMNRPYSETLKEFAVQKIRFHKFQKINLMLSYLLLVNTIILLSMFFSGKDLTGNKYFWIFSFSFGYIFLLFYSKWVSKYYNKTLRQAEDQLKELAS